MLKFMKKHPLCLILLLLASLQMQAQMTASDYVDRYKDIAIREMDAYGIPASITLAQGILESGKGNSTLARKANNHFGIKCHKGWSGKTFYMDDDAKNECFRSYRDVETSFEDHSKFLTTRNRYAFLFDLKKTDYKGWAKGLKKAGYATNPHYARLLIKIIEENELHQYDLADGRRHNRRRKKEHEKDTQTVVQTLPLNVDFPVVEEGPAGRMLYENNGVKLIYARKDDTFKQIADDFGIYTYQVYRYNEMSRKDKLIEGQIVYLEKKKGKSRTEFHLIMEGENMRQVSQRYGIRLKKLYRMNRMEYGSRPAAGQKIWLRKTKPAKS